MVTILIFIEFKKIFHCRFDSNLRRETQFDVDNLRIFDQTNFPNLLTDQRIAYDRVTHEITNQSG